MLKTLFLSILVCSAVGLYAQDSTGGNSLKPNQLFLGGGSFVCNEHIFPMNELGNKLLHNPEAYKEFNKYKSGQNVFNTSMFIWFIGSIAGLATLNSNNNISGKIFTASFVPLFIGVNFSNHSAKHLGKAIKIYNSQF